MSRMCFSVVVSLDYFVYIGFILIALLSGIYHIRFGLFVCILFSRYFESLEFYCVFDVCKDIVVVEGNLRLFGF